jgi:hypothetical protein
MHADVSPILPLDIFVLTS